MSMTLMTTTIPKLIMPQVVGPWSGNLIRFFWSSVFIAVDPNGGNDVDICLQIIGSEVHLPLQYESGTFTVSRVSSLQQLVPAKMMVPVVLMKRPS